MLDSEEQVQQCLPRAKFGSLSDLDEETDEDAAIATPSAGDLEDGDPEVPSSSNQSLGLPDSCAYHTI